MGWRLAREVLAGSPDMRYREFRVLIALALDGNDDTRQCLPGRELLALHGNCGARSVDRALAALRLGGHIKQVRRAAPGVRPVWEILPTGATCDSMVAHERESSTDNVRQNRGKRATAVVTPPKSLPKSPPKPFTPAKPPREDVERLCTHLAGRIEANGCKQPAITAKWRDAARLMLDRDGRTEDQAHAAIDWCQDDEFWRANILSMPKLREKYDQLQMQARRQHRGRRGDIDWDAAMARARARDRRPSTGDRAVAEAEELKAQLRPQRGELP